MKSGFYIQRTLTDDEKKYSEAALLAASRYIVVLAEPGGGKTELLHSLAHQLGTTAVTANVFGQLGANETNVPLVIDAFDELAKIDVAGINKLLGNARTAKPTHVIVSSRSSEWDNAATSTFRDFLGQAPLVVRLLEFDEAEQREIFKQHTPSEDFAVFQQEVARFDLEALLPNPQFLKLFADAYVQSGRRFTDKRSIFEQAVERLAKEANAKVTNSKLSTLGKLKLASEVFAKLLLSGAEGVVTSEVSEDRMHPLLASLINGDAAVDAILATRLFKPGDSANQHRSVHKIVSEYCAAGYLTKRIADPSDSLTLSKCLSIIAPNSTVRDELRGMLGWMASLGNQLIQEAAIDLDPYAVLANGDPSQLEPSSKRRLVSRLREIEDKDPYFRRGDFWRRFSVAGFFTQEVLDEIRPLLVDGTDGHLRILILELLAGSPAITKLADELWQIVLSPKEVEHARVMASRCLLEKNDHNHYADLEALITEASQTSLEISANIIEALGAEKFEKPSLSSFFRKCADLYPNNGEQSERTIGQLYFAKHLISCLGLEIVEWLLDDLSKGLVCMCSKKSYECYCRNGMSKIIGSILDRYFELATPPYDPERVWHWIRNLHFHENKNIEKSTAVKALREDDALRQGIIAYVFRRLTDRDEIYEAKINSFGWSSHAGLSFHASDYKFVVDLAFKTDNLNLWVSFIAHHQFYRNKEDRGPNNLRRQMREQALEKPEFMREWARSNRAVSLSERESRLPIFRRSRKLKRHRAKEDNTRKTNIKYVQENRQLVEGGRHWGFLNYFAKLVLMNPGRIENEIGDDSLTRNALRNCIDFIDEKVPDLHELAELRCASKDSLSVMILYAACLEIMRIGGDLGGVNIRLLRALRTNINTGYSAVSAQERAALKTEVDRLIFPDAASVESFLRQYVEPQISIQGCNNSELWWLRSDEVFSPLRGKLSIEWLRRFHDLPLGQLNTIFDIAAQHGDREELNEIIASRCEELISLGPNPIDRKDIEKKRKFWFLCAWYFLENPPEAYWNWLKSDEETVLSLYERSSRMRRSDHHSWPMLTPRKVEAILNAFIEKWPKVDLPDHWGTESPKGENAYRFLTEVIWSISSGAPDEAIPVLNRLLADPRFIDLHRDLKSMHAGQIRKKALLDFEPPTPARIVDLLDNCEVVTVEGLRALLIEELQRYQDDLDGSETTSRDVFYKDYSKKQRLGEIEATLRVADRLRLVFQSLGITVTPEHQLKDANRSDFTCSKVMGGQRKLLVTEVKGQWHRELYTAAKEQLHARYSIHPDAEKQGVFLVIWFGPHEEVAGRRKHAIGSAQELRASIEAELPSELKGLIDVFVLDVS